MLRNWIRRCLCVVKHKTERTLRTVGRCLSALLPARRLAPCPIPGRLFTRLLHPRHHALVFLRVEAIVHVLRHDRKAAALVYRVIVAHPVYCIPGHYIRTCTCITCVHVHVAHIFNVASYTMCHACIHVVLRLADHCNHVTSHDRLCDIT